MKKKGVNNAKISNIQKNCSLAILLAVFVVTFLTLVTAAQGYDMFLIKSASPTTYCGAGQNITYTYVITNSGNIDLSPENITVTDSKIGTFNITVSSPLNVSQSVVATANYTLTAADLCACSVT